MDVQLITLLYVFRIQNKVILLKDNKAINNITTIEDVIINDYYGHAMSLVDHVEIKKAGGIFNINEYLFIEIYLK
ncbi:MAG: hypothetical protein IJ094_12925 [Bacilli bacterium]|nr:hypothetical protein [Bacilli bacterium]